jgi:hypothetical protein
LVPDNLKPLGVLRDLRVSTLSFGGAARGGVVNLKHEGHKDHQDAQHRLAPARTEDSRKAAKKQRRKAGHFYAPKAQ